MILCFHLIGLELRKSPSDWTVRMQSVRLKVREREEGLGQ